MATESEVLVWNLNLPDTDYTLFYEFFDGAINENDVTKSYSVNDFIKGMLPNKSLIIKQDDILDILK